MGTTPILHEREYAGDVDRTVRVNEDVTVSELILPPLQAVPRHEHELARFGALIEGTMSEQSDQSVDDVHPGAVVFWSPGATHASWCGPGPIRCLQIELSERSFAGLRTIYPTAETTVLGEELFDGAMRALLREVRQPDAATPAAIEGAIHSLIARAHRVLTHRSATSRDVLRATGFISRNFHRCLTVAEIGAYLGLSSRTITQRFQDELGLSPGQYLRRARLEAAAGSLAMSDTPVGEIAVTCGFYDQAHLTREFHRRFGDTPLRYRKRHRSR